MTTDTRQRKIDYTPPMQRHIFAILMKRPGVLARVRPSIAPDHFADEVIGDLVAQVLVHWDEHKTPPSFATMLDTFSREEHEPHRRALKRAKADEDIDDTEHTVERITTYARNRAMRLAILRAAEIIHAEAEGTTLRDEKGKPVEEDPVELVSEASMVGRDTSNLGTLLDQRFIEESEKAITNPEKRETFGTTLAHLDEAGVLVERGEIGCVLGRAKAGKSQVLLNVALGNVKRGLNVVYYNMEVPQDRMRDRFFRRIAGRAGDQRTDPVAFYEKVKARAGKFLNGKLLIKKYPAYTVTMADIRAHLTQVVADEFKPDIVILDYLGLVRSSLKNADKRFQLEDVWLDFRGMAAEFNVAGWSAAQANRGGAAAELATMTDIGEAFSIVSHIDVGVSINITDEERELGTGRFYIFAARNDGDGRIVDFAHDFSRSMISTTGFAKAEKKAKKGGKMSTAEEREEAQFAKAQRERSQRA